MLGKIVKGIAGFYYVHVVESGVYECKAKGIFRKEKIKPLVGDNVEMDVIDGRIISQSLTSGEISKDTTISYVVSLGKDPDQDKPSDNDNNSDSNNSGGNNNNNTDDKENGDDSGSSSTDGPKWESNIDAWAKEKGVKYNVEYEKDTSVPHGGVIRYEENSDGSYTFYVSIS